MEDLLKHYRTMRLIRAFETKVDELFASGRVKGTTHLCAGQEATAVGSIAALRPSDYVVSNHRGHGHLLAKGGDPRRLMAELFGKSTGYSGGRGDFPRRLRTPKITSVATCAQPPYHG